MNAFLLLSCNGFYITEPGAGSALCQMTNGRGEHMIWAYDLLIAVRQIRSDK